MATVISSYHVPVNYVSGDIDSQVDHALTELRDRVRAEDDSSPLIGKVIRFQVADGYAEYMVASIVPRLELIHLDVFDGYTAHPALIRGLLVVEAKEMVDREERLKEIFRRRSA
jgi:hypothetical protein